MAWLAVTRARASPSTSSWTRVACHCPLGSLLPMWMSAAKFARCSTPSASTLASRAADPSSSQPTRATTQRSYAPSSGNAAFGLRSQGACGSASATTRSQAQQACGALCRGARLLLVSTQVSPPRHPLGTTSLCLQRLYHPRLHTLLPSLPLSGIGSRIGCSSLIAPLQPALHFRAHFTDCFLVASAGSSLL